MTDNFKAVYRILSALKKAMDLPGFDVQQIGQEALGATHERWCRYMEMMADVGYITGVEIRRFITGETSVDARDIRITLKGLEYLQENGIMRKLYKAAKGIAVP
ncbi:MAG: YjcQ family protein [Eubacteriales bacterium]|nr:YjcQ family protein [Eubacteriales bacterium]